MLVSSTFHQASVYTHLSICASFFHFLFFFLFCFMWRVSTCTKLDELQPGHPIHRHGAQFREETRTSKVPRSSRTPEISPDRHSSPPIHRFFPHSALLHAVLQLPRCICVWTVSTVFCELGLSAWFGLGFSCSSLVLSVRFVLFRTSLLLLCSRPFLSQSKLQSDWICLPSLTQFF